MLTPLACRSHCSPSSLGLRNPFVQRVPRVNSGKDSIHQPVGVWLL